MKRVKSIDSKTVFKDWERKERIYKLVGDLEPPYRQIRTRHISRSPLLVMDEAMGYEREIRYATNQKSPFVDEQNGFTKVSHLGIEEGVLTIAGNNISTQQFLRSHPDNQINGGTVFYELDLEASAIADTKRTEDKVEALIAVKQLTDEEVEYISFHTSGTKAFEDSIKVLKRELYNLSEREPGYVLELTNDNFIFNKGIAGKALKRNILKLADNERTVKWSTNSRKILSVAVDKTPTQAIAEFFLTDEGHEIKAKVTSKLAEL